MKFKINKTDIVDVLSKVQGLTGRRSNLAITENVLIRANEDFIHISATDLETGFEGSYSAMVESPGTIAVSARKFYEIVREFPSDEILVNEIENRWIEISNQKVQYHIVGLNPDDFPDTPRVNDVGFFDVDSFSLKKMIEQSVVISGAGDDKRAHINGIFFEKIAADENQILRMVSTDGSRLSASDAVYSKEEALPEFEPVLIPKKGLHEVGKFLSYDGTVQVGVQGSYFIAKKERELLVIRLLEGDFPKYAEIIKKRGGNDLVIDKASFAKMLKRMTILSSENYKGAIFNFRENELIVTATNPDIGEAKEDMAITFEGDEIEAGFNPKYFIDSLSLIDDENIVLNITSEDLPCLLQGENNKNYLSVIMPMKI